MKVSILLLIVSLFGTLALAAKPQLADRTTDPLFPAEALEVVANLELPPGNVAVSPNSRVFFTFFPGAFPKTNVAEWVDGAAKPYPNEKFQREFQSPLGLRIDRQNRLWVLDAGVFAFGKARLLAFDLATNQLIDTYDFPKSLAPLGSMLNDFQISHDGNTVFVSDTSNVAQKPALIVYDLLARTGIRLLEKDASVSDGPYDVFVHGKRMLNLGAFPLHFGIDAIALDRQGQWLYFASLNAGNLYRVRADELVAQLRNRDTSSPRTIEKFADTSMTDGITTDDDGNIYLSDMEHSAINRVSQDRATTTLFKDEKLLRWPDGFSFGLDGWLYVTCSSLQHVLPNPFQAEIKKSGPFQIYRFKSGSTGTPGH